MRNIKDIVILIGYDEAGNCVYSDSMDFGSYYDGEHVWDDDKKVLRLKLRRVKGYMFDEEGNLDQ